jgi:hypothetical protein
VDPESGEPVEEPGTAPGSAQQEARTCLVCGTTERPVTSVSPGLLGARAGGRGRRCGRLWCKALVDEYDTVRGSVPGSHPDLPVIALTNKNHTPIALDWDRFAVLALPSLTPFSGCPRFVASRAYQVKGIPVDLVDAVFGVPPLVHVRKPFLNGLPTGDWPLWRN